MKKKPEKPEKVDLKRAERFLWKPEDLLFFDEKTGRYLTYAEWIARREDIDTEE